MKSPIGSATGWVTTGGNVSPRVSYLDPDWSEPGAAWQISVLAPAWHLGSRATGLKDIKACKLLLIAGMPDKVRRYLT